MATTEQPRILLIYTGGTIGMIENPETGMLEPFDFTHLIDNVPKIKLLNYVIGMWFWGLMKTGKKKSSP